MSTRVIPFGVNVAGVLACRPSYFMWRVPRNSGSLTSWTPKGLYRFNFTFSECTTL